MVSFSYKKPLEEQVEPNQAVPAMQESQDDDDDFDATLTAINLTRRTFGTFYNQRLKQWCSPYNEPGTIDDIHGYTCWPVAIGLWACANLVKTTHDQDDIAMLDQAFEGLEKHWNEEYQGYCAWTMYPGNTDIYYDDNAHAGNALLTAYEATQKPHYLARAAALTRGILTRGLDSDASSPGYNGIAWHIADNPPSRNACSTLAVAVLAARLALHGIDARHNAALATRTTAFADARLHDPADNLILDAWARQPDGAWAADTRKFSYNAGFAMHAHALLFALTGAPAHLARANDIADAAVAPASALMDASVAVPVRARMWADATFFAAHCLEGLAQVVRLNGLAGACERSRRIAAFARRASAWVRVWNVDCADGLSLRALRPYVLDARRAAAFAERYGVAVAFVPDEGEREAGEAPVAERRVIKTLLGCAGAAGCFWWAGEIARAAGVEGEMVVDVR